MMPTVEINMEHNHRTSRETCHQKSVRKKSVLFCVISLAVLFLTFDHAIRPRTGFHYHKLGMHKVGPNWTSSKPRQYRGHHRKSGIHHLATSPNTKKNQKKSTFRFLSQVTKLLPVCDHCEFRVLIYCHLQWKPQRGHLENWPLQILPWIGPDLTDMSNSQERPKHAVGHQTSYEPKWGHLHGK